MTIASRLFSQKIASTLVKNCISKLNKNNLRLFRFFHKLSTAVYLVASCDCFVIIMFLEKGKFGFDLLRHSAYCMHTLFI